MTDELLPYYRSELQYLKQQAASFAARHAKIASRLKLDGQNVEDPHIERLIQAVAFLNARIRHKLDDDFPEITEALLSILYPQYLAPIPSMAIVETWLPETLAELTAGKVIPRGTPVETEPIREESAPVRFRTTSPVHVWPISVSHAALEHRPFDAPDVPAARSAPARICIALKTHSTEVALGQLQGPDGGRPPALRFYINGQPPFVNEIHEALLTSVVGVAMCAPGVRSAKQFAPSCIRPVGFAMDELMLPDVPRCFPGYQLLLEYFAFPQKFLFIDIVPPDEVWESLGPRAEIHLFLNRQFPDLASSIDVDTFRLGCTPIVNLFEKSAEPIDMNHAISEYRIVPDARRPMSHEVYSVDRVVGATTHGDEIEFAPLYSIRHGGDAEPRSKAFWHATRRSAETTGATLDRGTEVFLSLFDLDGSAINTGSIRLLVKTTCLNRNRPATLPFGGGEPRLQFLDAAAGDVRLRCLTRPTPTRRPALGHGTRWRVISHLSLNGLSLSDSEGPEGLREILKLYEHFDLDHERQISRMAAEQIEGLTGARFQRTTGRMEEVIRGRRHQFICRGILAELHFDETKYSGGGPYLLASVLERFLGLYCSINSFVQTRAVTSNGKVYQWPQRAGDQVLL